MSRAKLATLQLTCRPEKATAKLTLLALLAMVRFVCCMTFVILLTVWSSVPVCLGKLPLKCPAAFVALLAQ